MRRGRQWFGGRAVWWDKWRDCFYRREREVFPIPMCNIVGVSRNTISRIRVPEFRSFLYLEIFTPHQLAIVLHYCSHWDTMRRNPANRSLLLHTLEYLCPRPAYIRLYWCTTLVINSHHECVNGHYIRSYYRMWQVMQYQTIM